ncbi:Peptidyl-prolyl cis-trans isomerase CYP37, chloroplastic [Dendrobium catenatum]|uniref:Peptidyl-prolyl cis-trans isomerase CYP37, chloroplastic n=1 Tax=Dendrobium catenatum TaxID=906689 RepID=A0A2I0X9P3_9ASPA|nr:Peptidyl-prolyl cis-trans isomerase CYP37, chloroplastic [Dendrobium catenatum]
MASAAFPLPSAISGVICNRPFLRCPSFFIRNSCLRPRPFAGGRARANRFFYLTASAKNKTRSLRVPPETLHQNLFPKLLSFSAFYQGLKKAESVIAAILILCQSSFTLPLSSWDTLFISSANAVLFSPDTKVPRTGELALRRAIPANANMKAIQDSLEDISYLLRIPQRKPYGTMEGDVKKALKIAMEQKESILGTLPEELKEKGSLLYTSLTDGKGGLKNLIDFIKENDPDKISIVLQSSLDTLAELELLQSAQFLCPKYAYASSCDRPDLILSSATNFVRSTFVLPTQARLCISDLGTHFCVPISTRSRTFTLWPMLMRSACLPAPIGGMLRLLHSLRLYTPNPASSRLPRLQIQSAPLACAHALTGRGVVNLVVEKSDGSTFFPTSGGEPKSFATIQVVLDGYSAPLTAGNFAKLVIDGAYDGVRLKCANQAVLSDNELENYGYSLPLELKPSGEFEPLYKTALSIQDGELPVLPLSVYGAVAMAHNTDSEEYSSPSQFFFYLYDKRNNLFKTVKNGCKTPAVGDVVRLEKLDCSRKIVFAAVLVTYNSSDDLEENGQQLNNLVGTCGLCRLLSLYFKNLKKRTAADIVAAASYLENKNVDSSLQGGRPCCLDCLEKV